MDLDYNINLLKNSYNKFNFKELDIDPIYNQSISGRASDSYYKILVTALCPCGIKNYDGFILNGMGLFEFTTEELFSEELLIEHLKEDGLL